MSPSDWLEAGGTSYRQGLPLSPLLTSMAREEGLPASSLVRNLEVPVCPVSVSQGGTHWTWLELRRYSWSK